MTAARDWVERLVLLVVTSVLAVWAILDASVHGWGGVPLPVRLVAGLTATLPLLALRRRPELVAAVVTAAVLVLGVGWRSNDVPPVLDFGLLVAAFGVGAFATHRRWLVWAVLGVGAAVANLTGPDEADLNDAVWIVGTWLLALILGLLVADRGRYEDEQRTEAAQTREAAPVAASEALADERARIARDLHDVVTRSVAVMVDHARTGRSAAIAGDHTLAGGELTVVETTGRDALAELRRMLDVMRGTVDRAAEPQPGLEAMPGLVAGLEVRGDPLSVPAGVGVAAYRLVEQLARDARVTAAVVTAEGGRLRLDLGVEARRSPASAELRERVGLYGGHLVADRGPTGWRLRVELPGGPGPPDETCRPSYPPS